MLSKISLNFLIFLIAQALSDYQESKNKNKSLENTKRKNIEIQQR